MENFLVDCPCIYDDASVQLLQIYEILSPSEILFFTLQDFETRILKAMKEDGWDGWEDEDKKIQWTFAGSLFYSIIVITTIGEFILAFLLKK